VSPLTRKKNVHNVIEAMNILVNQRKLDGVRLKIVGDGPERAAIEGLAAQYGLGDRVAFLGFVSDAQVVRTYQAARLTVYVPIDEPFGLVPLESMACGTPVVASDHGGPLDSVVANETGLHVNPFDPEAIADAIQALFCDEARLRAMGASGARWVRERFTLEGFLDRFEQMALRS
jgi:glycosyltransferase involved in cell wall biosynthesis